MTLELEKTRFKVLLLSLLAIGNLLELSAHHLFICKMGMIIVLTCIELLGGFKRKYIRSIWFIFNNQYMVTTILTLTRNKCSVNIYGVEVNSLTLATRTNPSKDWITVDKIIGGPNED